MNDTQISINDKPPYKMTFQNNFLEMFGLNTNIIYFHRMKDKAYMDLEVYPVRRKATRAVYLPCKFMNYICRYRYEN